MAVVWLLRQERNARVFEDKYADVEEVWSKIKMVASLWASTSNLFGKSTISEISNNWGGNSALII